jgi:phosphoserine phosphatase
MRDTIAIIFDFDDTLAPDSTSGFLQRSGVDVPWFWQERVAPLLQDDWDPIPAYLYRMIELSNSGDIEPITRSSLARWGRELALYPGVDTVFQRLHGQVRGINPRVRLETYLISSGIGEVLRHTAISHRFADIWASEFAYDDSGRILFPKKVVSFTDKTRYIFQVHKGFFGNAFKGRPFEVNRKVAPDQVRVPWNQMIVVGDGYTDIPCFSLVRSAGGIAIGVYDTDRREKWGRAWGFIEDGRVSNLVPADYTDGSALSNSLAMAVESMARRLAHSVDNQHG